ncbi:ParB/RepB/Spo0J family partition protein [Brevundimonas sp. TWP2-3-4b1]|uniref:ParB/RepB/Spo0J family partition protein n=1 Tax=Brevundimonas sp. TWP2-3-4b1 TaxID=2804580 RepID=UPI003CF8A9EF
MSERQRGLGRGLSALMGESINEPVPVALGAVLPTGVLSVPIESLKPNPDQPRKQFTKADHDELTQSIRDKGVLQPILVRQQPGEDGVWQIIAGERRWRAAQGARLTEVPVIIREMDDLEVLEVAIIENVQRADLNPLEEAAAYGVLMERFGRTQDAVAGIVGKSRSHVANTLRLTQLSPGAREHVLEGRLSAGHARALLTARDPDTLADQVVAQGLNVRQTEALARKSQDEQKPKLGKSSADQASVSPDIAALEQDLADALGVRIALADRGGKGELTLSYASLEQLDDLCRRLMRA